MKCRGVQVYCPLLKTTPGHSLGRRSVLSTATPPLTRETTVDAGVQICLQAPSRGQSPELSPPVFARSSPTFAPPLEYLPHPRPTTPALIVPRLQGVHIPFPSPPQPRVT